MNLLARLIPGLSDKEQEMLTDVFQGGYTHAVIPLRERLLIVSVDEPNPLLPTGYYPLEISVTENPKNKAVEVRCYMKGCMSIE